MQRDSNGGHKFSDFNAKWPACMCCQDEGIVGGGDIPFAWCKCPAGVQRSAMEREHFTHVPGKNSVDAANAEREKMGLGSK